MQECDENSCGPILDLISALSCDLREDFFPFFPTFFLEIQKLITKDQQDADILNHCFNCLSHMVYFLHRCMLKDLKGTIDLFIPLLTNKKQHLRTFSAGCIAFFLHKIPTAKFLRLLWQLHKSDSSLTSDYGGDILAETLRSMDGKFHSCCTEVIPGIMDLAVGNWKEVTESSVERRRHSKRLRREDTQNDVDSFLDEEAAHFCMLCLTRALELLTNSGLKPESLLATGKLYFSRLSDPNLVPSRASLLVAGLDSLITLLYNKKHINQFEEILYELFRDCIAKQPSLPLAKLALKFVNMQYDVAFKALVHTPLIETSQVLEETFNYYCHLSPLSTDVLPLLPVEAKHICGVLAQCKGELAGETNLNLLVTCLCAVYDAWLSSNMTNETKENQPDLSNITFDFDFHLQLAAESLTTRPELSCVFLRIIDLCSQAGLLKDFGNAGDRVERLLPFLMSFSHQIRLHTLRILRCLLMRDDSCGTGLLTESPLTVIDRCLTCERTKHCPNSLRELLATILHLHSGRTGVFKSTTGAKVCV
ncbi:unnamed protein product [Dibothriocephalus latus]|uniref:Uncharacterized protein n=1 Tax=Dibothriocephalus latus TaxID=60516 RepID=A0A3P6V696_DIBLA|nr:unnamed protein product [Dibothriocephalus latus]